MHDEVIIEGPAELAAEAKARMVALMERPFGDDVELRVALAVDADYATTWFDAK